MDEDKSKRLELKPALGLLDATAISIGAIVGAGVFVVTGIAAGQAGSALVVSMVIAAFIALFTALSFAELTAWQPKEGSVYEYAYQLISPFAGFLTGWMWIASNTFAGAAVSLGFASYLNTLLPVLSLKGTAVLLCLAFTFLNFLGARQSALLNNILVVAKLVILGLFVVYGFFHLDCSNFASFDPMRVEVLYGSFFVFFAYGGFARVAVIAEEVKEAKKNVPRAIVISLAISTIIYVFVGLVAVGLVGAARLAESNSPLIEAIEATRNTLVVYLVSAGGLIATASVLLTAILGVSRMAYSMASRKDMPHFLSKLHPKYATPYYSIWIAGTAMALLVLFVDLSRVVAMSTFAMLFYYTLANICALKMRTVKKGLPENRAFSRRLKLLYAFGFYAFCFATSVDCECWSFNGWCCLLPAQKHLASNELTKKNA